MSNSFDFGVAVDVQAEEELGARVALLGEGLQLFSAATVSPACSALTASSMPAAAGWAASNRAAPAGRAARTRRTRCTEEASGKRCRYWRNGGSSSIGIEAETRNPGTAGARRKTMLEQLTGLVNGDAALVRRGRHLPAALLVEARPRRSWLVHVLRGRIEKVEEGRSSCRRWRFALRADEAKLAEVLAAPAMRRPTMIYSPWCAAAS